MINMETKYVYFETYGCQANKNNTEIMKGLVRQAGLEITNNPDVADILVINTCIVKEPTEKKIERRISDLIKLYPKKPLIIAGCMPQVRKIKQENIFLLGTHHIKDITKLIRKIYENKVDEDFVSERNEEKLCLPKIPEKRDVGITQISEGCVGNCTFCITRLAKGKLFSYSEEKILKNIKNDLQSGAKEIWITSQDNAAYGLDKGKRKLPDLLRKILSLKGKFKVRVGMMNPENVLPILDELVEIYKHKKMKKFLHIPVQSGSNKILKLMNRRYKVEDFIKIVDSFKKEIPDLTLWTDIIVGFPGETEKDFEESLNLVKKIKPSFINISRFWVRKGTPAEKMKQLPQQEVKKRVKKLISLFKEIKASKFCHNSNQL